MKSLLGAVIGGAVGIGLLLAIHWFTGKDQAWLALLVALTTGVGVRAMTATKGHASYLRGAITALLALAAFMIATSLFAKVATWRASQEMQKAPPKPSVEEPAETAEGQPAEETKPPETSSPEPAMQPRPAANPKAAAPAAFSPWDFVWLAVAGLVAYELGRGTAADPRAGQPTTPPPDAA